MDRLLPRPTSVLEARLRPSGTPSLAPHLRPAAVRTEPVLRCGRASRQLSLPFCAPASSPRAG